MHHVFKQKLYKFNYKIVFMLKLIFLKPETRRHVLSSIRSTNSLLYIERMQVQQHIKPGIFDLLRKRLSFILP